jgi:hypothetical protein
MNKALEAAREAQRIRKEQGIAVKRKTPTEKAKDNPNSLRLAVNAKCWECCGEGYDGRKDTIDRIATCNVRDCSLWNLRPYQDKNSMER